jgi:hypothetical protein
VEVDGIGELDRKVVVNLDNIWWMDDSYGNAPWSPSTLFQTESSSLLSSSSLSTFTSSIVDDIRIRLWFTRIVHEENIASILNLVDTQIGWDSNLEPVESTNVTNGSHASSNVRFKVLPSEDVASLVYTVGIRQFTTLAGRTARLRLGLVVGGADGSGTAASIIGGLTVSVSRMASAESLLREITTESSLVSSSSLIAGGSSTLADISAQALTFEVQPSTPAENAAGTYFYIATEQIDLERGETLFYQVSWDGSGLGGDARIYAVIPVVEVPES